MTGTINDLVEADLPEGQEGYMEFASRAPKVSDSSFLNSIKDYGKTILKGAVEGLSTLGHAMGQSDASHKYNPEEFTERLNELLPTEEGYGQKAIRRGLNLAPSAISQPFGGAIQSGVRSLAAGAASEGTKELGLPEWTQTAAELTSFIGPDITKNLLSKGSNKEIIDAARKLGLSDQQIAPLLQSDIKQKWLSSLAQKTGTTAKNLAKTKEGLSEAYQGLQTSEKALQSLPKESQNLFIDKLDKILESIPSEVRKLIKDDLVDLTSKPITGESLMNFYADINHNLGNKSKQLSLIKKPVKDAISSISKELGEDFESLNKLYSKFQPISSKLKPTIVDQMIKGGESLGILYSFFNGDVSSLSIIAGEKVARKIMGQMLTNPKFQQLGLKTVEALNQNKPTIAKKLINSYAGLIKNDSKELYDSLKNISDEEIQSLINHPNQE